jgi:hypothetical protein
MLLPDRASARRGEVVTFTYQWGHPFEHQLFDAPAPQRVAVLVPGGGRADLAPVLEEGSVSVPDQKEARVYRFR